MGDKGLTVGLTGNIACGKSTAARALESLGVPVIDADALSRELMAPGSPLAARVEQELGTSDRAALRDLVFNDAAKRKLLESILHPAIQLRSRELIKAMLDDGNAVVVYEASLLIESGRHVELDGLLVITCPPAQQKRRLMARDAGLSAELADRMIGAQLSQSEKSAKADWIISNDAGPEQLVKKIKTWHYDLTRRIK